MNFERLEKLAFHYMGNKKSHLDREIGAAFYHGKRVSQSVVELRKAVFPDNDSMDEILRCAGLFHDIGKGLEPHNHSGAVLVRDLLKNELTAEEIDKVCYLIEVHDDRQPESDTYDWCAKLLQDADLVDHFGGQGVWLTCVYGAFTNCGSMKDVVEYQFSEGLPSAEENSKLLNYAYSREVMRDKVNFERQVYERFAVECQGKFVL